MRERQHKAKGTVGVLVMDILITALLVIAAYAAYPYLRELIYVKPKRRR